MGDFIIDYVEHADVNEDLSILTSSRNGLVKQEDHFGRLQQHDISDWNVIPQGYCTYRNRSDDGLFTFNVNKTPGKGLVSKFYPVFSLNGVDADFFVNNINSNAELTKNIFALAVGTSQVVLAHGALKTLEMRMPTFEEQRVIGCLLNQLDNLITLHQRKPFSRRETHVRRTNRFCRIL